MTPPPRDVLFRIRKLAALPEEIRQSRYVSITRLTVLKSLCQEPEVANRFVTYLARKTLDSVHQKHEKTSHAETSTEADHRAMMEEALKGMEAWQETPTATLRQSLLELNRRIAAEQNEYRNIPYGAVRLITDSKLLLIEYALSCLLAHQQEIETWAYQTARHYAERYTSSEGTGLISSSIPLVQDIVEFWMQEYELTPDSLAAPPKKRAEKPPPSQDHKKTKKGPNMEFTARQGQFLAFIHLYRKLHRRSPAETDLVKFFRVTPPSVHGMIVKLEELGLRACLGILVIYIRLHS
ncbi:hypothetical protein [Fimbriiglobus ruber]|uniref:Uncharacterized protein n=1 Tax=Fimbriiglobus ruber TaxID=1908690 RepID=A0A225DRL0_9BACT|nr:hypothetical protein [Fimbriiglobus ruber]OWK43733.1 hypothetical protein FRUB_03332 [Fimbriiglobus ruber]